MANGIMDNVFNKLYNQDTIANLEAQYGLGGSGLPSQARHQAALNELSKNLNIGNFGPGNLFTALAASATEIPDVIKTGDIKESARDVFDNLKGALATDKSKTPAEVYRDVYEGGSNQSGIVEAVKNAPSFLSNLFFTPAGAGSDVPNLPNIDITDELDDYYEKGEMMPNVAEARDRNLLSGIIQNLNPKDAVSFVTSLLTGGKTKALSGIASFADKLGIRRGMQEPRGAIGTGGYGVSRPGNTLTDRTRANRAQFSDFYSNFQGGAQHQMGKRVDDVISRTAQGRRTRSDAQGFVNKYGSQEQKDRFNQAKAPKAAKGSFRAAQDEGTTGSSKIVCTMMNKSYGFGSFRNKIWMKFHKDLSPEYQKGYHKIFLPLVKIAKKNKIVKKILEHIAVHSTIDMRQSMRGKKHLLGRLYRKIILPICYWAGKK